MLNNITADCLLLFPRRTVTRHTITASLFIHPSITHALSPYRTYARLIATALRVVAILTRAIALSHCRTRPIAFIALSHVAQLDNNFVPSARTRDTFISAHYIH